MNRPLASLFGGVLLGTLISLSAHAQISLGDPVTAGSGSIRSFVDWESGAPSRIGFRINAAAFSSFGTDAVSYRLALPSGAAGPYNHLEVDWNPHGHPGPGYGVPHFDFHFYTISSAEQDSIPFGLPPFTHVPSEYIAPGYIPDMVQVPMMGVHYLDTLSPEFGGAPFTQTFIYGYHNGSMDFLEPMITQATLAAGGTALLPVRWPAKVKAAGYYPTEYGYEVADGNYDIFLGGLQYRASAVPEPSTYGLAGLSLMLGLALVRKVRKGRSLAPKSDTVE